MVVTSVTRLHSYWSILKPSAARTFAKALTRTHR
jgi:hypothetical protein